MYFALLSVFYLMLFPSHSIPFSSSIAFAASSFRAKVTYIPTAEVEPVLPPPPAPCIGKVRLLTTTLLILPNFLKISLYSKKKKETTWTPF
jgi:hypothetical protein